MVEQMHIHLKNLGLINEANISMDRITVVGGSNSSGKSTLSKFLYSFLRSNSINRQEIAYETVFNLIKEQSRNISSFLNKIGIMDSGDFKLPRLKPRNCDAYEKMIDAYEFVKCNFVELNESGEYFEKIINNFNLIDEVIEMVDANQNQLYVELMKKLLQSEFSTNQFNFVSRISNDSNFDFEIDLKNHDLNSNDAFNAKGGLILNDIYYIDSVSILDTFDNMRFLASERKTVDHIEFLKNSLNNRQKTLEIFDDTINKEIIDLEKQVNRMIGGEFIYEKGEFTFVSSKNIKSLMHNTASGIKQIGIIQLLLANRRLKQGCVLIIDEPEVNLHPDWQMKFAEILVLIVKKLNISLYINSHSPVFIEALNTFTHYYDLSDVTNYYLAESGNGSGFNINHVDENDLSRIYDNLGRAYFALDMIRSEKDF